VTWRLKAGIVEPERTSIARQRFAKHIHKVTQSTIGHPLLSSRLLRFVAPQKTSNRMSEPFEMMIYIRSAWKLVQSRKMQGSNTSTVALWVLGGDTKGSLESETVKYGPESHGTQTRERLRWRGSATIVNDKPVFSSERAPHTNKPATVWQ
jgi:hypothetical protein